MTPQKRSSIDNAIWLCQTHAKLIDDDRVEWPASRLHCVKKEHENVVQTAIGVPRSNEQYQNSVNLTPQEYAFVFVRDLASAYKAILAPMLHEHNLIDENELGLLMIGTPPESTKIVGRQTPWTAFVNPTWLRWVLVGQGSRFRLNGEVPPDQIYGRIPAWPDTFYEFLAAIIDTGTTFEWQTTIQGYLILAQQR